MGKGNYSDEFKRCIRSRCVGSCDHYPQSCTISSVSNGA